MNPSPLDIRRDKVAEESTSLELADIRELIALAAVEFAASRRADFYDYLEKNHPFLHQFYTVDGEG